MTVVAAFLRDLQSVCADHGVSYELEHCMAPGSGLAEGTLTINTSLVRRGKVEACEYCGVSAGYHDCCCQVILRK
jgi:hypothetical protein